MKGHTGREGKVPLCPRCGTPPKRFKEERLDLFPRPAKYITHFFCAGCRAAILDYRSAGLRWVKPDSEGKTIAT